MLTQMQDHRLPNFFKILHVFLQASTDKSGGRDEPIIHLEGPSRTASRLAIAVKAASYETELQGQPIASSLW
jgi:hypothetical protein